MSFDQFGSEFPIVLNIPSVTLRFATCGDFRGAKGLVFHHIIREAISPLRPGQNSILGDSYESFYPEAGVNSEKCPFLSSGKRTREAVRSQRDKNTGL